MFLWTPDIDTPLLHQFKFSLWKKPVSWKRPEPGITAGGKKFQRKNKDDRGHQNDIRGAFTRSATRQHMLDLFPWQGPVVICIYNFFNRPKSWYAGKQVDGRPDVDNLAKQVMDALNPDGAGGWGSYADDAQAIDLLVSKRYSQDGDSIICQLLLFEKAVKPLGPRQQRKLLTGK